MTPEQRKLIIEAFTQADSLEDPTQALVNLIDTLDPPYDPSSPKIELILDLGKRTKDLITCIDKYARELMIGLLIDITDLTVTATNANYLVEVEGLVSETARDIDLTDIHLESGKRRMIFIPKSYLDLLRKYKSTKLKLEIYRKEGEYVVLSSPDIRDTSIEAKHEIPSIIGFPKYPLSEHFEHTSSLNLKWEESTWKFIGDKQWKDELVRIERTPSGEALIEIPSHFGEELHVPAIGEGVGDFQATIKSESLIKAKNFIKEGGAMKLYRKATVSNTTGKVFHMDFVEQKGGDFKCLLFSTGLK